MSRFISDALGALAPYTPGEQPQGAEYIKLNTNENPYPPAPDVLKAVQAEAEKLALYPDPQVKCFMQLLAEEFGLPEEQVFAGNGSDEVLAFCFGAFCSGGVAFPDITYGFYPVYATLFGLDAKIVPLKEDFTLDVNDYVNVGRTVVIANPNAPTGLALGLSEIEALLKTNPKNLVIIDEAYVDFGAQSALPLLGKYDNLLIVGTFSKSRSLAGARLGYALGSKEVISDLNRVKFSFNPYSLNRMSLAAGQEALKDKAYFKSCVQKVVSTREKTEEALIKMGFQCTKSMANFVFTAHPRLTGEQLYEGLKQKGILVRWFNSGRIKDFIRISVGTDADMQALITALKEMCEVAK